MNHVRSPARPAGSLNNLADGEVLDPSRARCQVVRVAAPACYPDGGRGLGALRVDQQRGIEIAENAERFLHLPGGDRRKVFRPRVCEEALESENACAPQRRELAEIAWDDAAPEPDVDMTLTPRRLSLRLERRDADRAREAVERHVDQRGDPSGCRGACGRGEAFPFGIAGLADMHVRVDQA